MDNAEKKRSTSTLRASFWHSAKASCLKGPHYCETPCTITGGHGCITPQQPRNGRLPAGDVPRTRTLLLASAELLIIRRAPGAQLAAARGPANHRKYRCPATRPHTSTIRPRDLIPPMPGRSRKQSSPPLASRVSERGTDKDDVIKGALPRLAADEMV